MLSGLRPRLEPVGFGIGCAHWVDRGHRGRRGHRDAVLLSQNMFMAGTGQEFGTLATDVANLAEDCAPYR